MNKYIESWDDILALVRDDKSINFTALAVTPWNALSIDALLLYLSHKGIIIKAVIVIAEHYSAGYMIDPSFFTNKCSEYYYYPAKDQKKSWGLSKADSKEKRFGALYEILSFYRLVFFPQPYNSDTLYYSTFDHSIPDVSLLQKLKGVNRKIILCYTEEGVGEYMGTYNKTYKKWHDVKSLSEYHDYIRNVFFGQIIYKLLHKSYNSLTLKHRFNNLNVNKDIIPFYKEIFKYRLKNTRPAIDKKIITNSIIICTTAWKRELIKNNEDLIVLSKVCDYLWKKGIHLLLKTHPRDSFFETTSKDLHCERLNVPDLSIESLCEFAKPKAIISFSSTTLINPNIFWDIPTYCLTEMLNRANIDDFYLEEVDAFKRTFTNFVTFVKTPEEIVF